MIYKIAHGVQLIPLIRSGDVLPAISLSDVLKGLVVLTYDINHGYSWRANSSQL